MLVVVNQPLINNKFEIMGDNIPTSVIKFLDSEFGKDNITYKNEDNEEFVDYKTMDWYKETKKQMSPGKYLRIYRKRDNLKQEELGKLLGKSKQYISNMENGLKPISKETAKQLAKIFNTSVARFI